MSFDDFRLIVKKLTDDELRLMFHLLTSPVGEDLIRAIHLVRIAALDRGIDLV